MDNHTLIDTCQARMRPQVASINQVAVNLYEVEANHRYVVTVHCGPNHQENEMSSNTVAILVSLAPGCVGQTAFGRFTATEVVAQVMVHVGPSHIESALEPILGQLGQWQSFTKVLEHEDRKKGVLLANFMRRISQEPWYGLAYSYRVWGWIKDLLILAICAWIAWSICAGRRTRNPIQVIKEEVSMPGTIRLRGL